jgi:hypothetical protein
MRLFCPPPPTPAAGRCRLLLSEDLQEGFTWSGVTVTNPFSTSRHPLLEAMLKLP